MKKGLLIAIFAVVLLSLVVIANPEDKISSRDNSGKNAEPVRGDISTGEGKLVNPSELDKEGTEAFCHKFRHDNCPSQCVVGPSCPICLNIGCHAKGEHTAKNASRVVPIGRRDKAKQIEEKLQIVKVMNPADIREHQKEQLSIAVDKCRKMNLSSELCEKKHEMRAGLIENLKEKDLERLNRIEEKKLKSEFEFENLKNHSKLREIAISHRFELREIKEEHKERIKLKIKETESEDINFNEKIKTAEVRLIELKKRTLACRNETRSEVEIETEDNATEIKNKTKIRVNCAKARNESFEFSKEYLLNVADKSINALERLKARANSSQFLSQEEANSIINDINSEEAKINSIKLRIGQATTREELRNINTILREEWVKIRELFHSVKLKIELGHFGGIIVKSRHLEVKLDKILKKLVIENRSIEEIEPLVNQFNEKISKSKEHFEEAQEKFREAMAAEKNNKSELFKEANEHIKEAREALKEAKKLLEEIKDKIRKEDESVLKEPDVEDSNED